MIKNSFLIMVLFVGGQIFGAVDQEAAQASSLVQQTEQQKPLARFKEAHPNAKYGLTYLPAAWAKAESNPDATKTIAGLALIGSIGATYNNPKATAQATLAAAVVAAGAWGWSNYNNAPVRRWWDFKTDKNDGIEINPKDIVLPRNFRIGTGISAYQSEGFGPNNGGPDTSVYSPEYRQRFLEKVTDKDKKKYFEDFFAKTYPDEVGIACDSWNRFEQDSKEKAKLGLNADRFSISWPKVQPKEGEFSQEALDHYARAARTNMENNMLSIIGFHHYDDPEWWLNMGGFEKKENIDIYVNYCTKVAQAIYLECKKVEGKQHLLPLMYSYNAANAYAINGYQQGTRPPYEKNMQKSRTVLSNMLEAHVRMYKAIKAAAPELKIGTTINVYELEPVNHYNPLERIKCYIGNKLAQTDTYRFFKEGEHSCWIPFIAQEKFVNKEAPNSLDWVGLNYYSNGFMTTTGGPFADPELPSTNNDKYAINPEGLYSALFALDEVCNSKENVAKRNGKIIPIIVTETGIGVGDDHAKRKMLLERYLYAISQAYQHGIPVEGIAVWSYMDNYEWGTYGPKYGLCTKDRTLREGAQVYVDIIKNHTKDDTSITLVPEQ